MASFLSYKHNASSVGIVNMLTSVKVHVILAYNTMGDDSAL